MFDTKIILSPLLPRFVRSTQKLREPLFCFLLATTMITLSRRALRSQPSLETLIRHLLRSRCEEGVSPVPPPHHARPRCGPGVSLLPRRCVPRGPSDPALVRSGLPAVGVILRAALCGQRTSLRPLLSNFKCKAQSLRSRIGPVDASVSGSHFSCPKAPKPRSGPVNSSPLGGHASMENWPTNFFAPLQLGRAVSAMPLSHEKQARKHVTANCPSLFAKARAAHRLKVLDDLRARYLKSRVDGPRKARELTLFDSARTILARPLSPCF